MKVRIITKGRTGEGRFGWEKEEENKEKERT